MTSLRYPRYRIASDRGDTVIAIHLTRQELAFLIHRVDDLSIQTSAGRIDLRLHSSAAEADAAQRRIV